MNVVNNESTGVEIALGKYCLYEIETKLTKIEMDVTNYKQNNERDTLIQIISDLQTIEDLAMVYGYEGIETLAYHLSDTLNSEITTKKHIPEDLLLRLSIAIDAMRNISDIEDERKIYHIIDNTLLKISNDEKEPDDEQKKNDTDETNIIGEESNELETKKNPLEITSKGKEKLKFDITETHSIMKLIKKIDENTNHFNQENPLNNRNCEVQTINKLEDISEKIERVFNDVFVEESLESLDYLHEYLQAIRDSKAIGEAIMHIKEACSSLFDSANCFNIAAVKPSLILLNQIVKERLSFDKKPSPIVLEVLTDAERTLRDYLKNNEGDFTELVEKLNYVINENDISDNHNTEETT